jgi:hypothetical protein
MFFFLCKKFIFSFPEREETDRFLRHDFLILESPVISSFVFNFVEARFPTIISLTGTISLSNCRSKEGFTSFGIHLTAFTSK